MKETPKGAYADTPHKTIEELSLMAEERTSRGEEPYHVRQDIVNGYSLGFGSRNDWTIQCACEAGLAAHRATRLNHSPWGPTHSERIIAAGIVCVTTARHGGYYVAPERMAEMPDVLVKFVPYAAPNWYEEDCDWAIVALAFPQHFDGRSLHYALDMFTISYSGLARQVRLSDYLTTEQGKAAKAKASSWFEQNKLLFEFGGQYGGADGCGGEIVRVDRKQRLAYKCKEWPCIVGPLTLDQARAAGLTLSEVTPPSPAPVAEFNEADCGGVFDGRQVWSDTELGGAPGF